MSAGTRINLADAKLRAADFQALFSDCFDRWEVAGSIRRARPDVGDIEHVVIPKYSDPDRDLFGAATGPGVSLIRRRVNDLLDSGKLKLHLYGDAKTTRNGEKYIGVDFNGVLHEVFMCEEGNWGPTLAIRTGSGEFSKMLVTRIKRGGYRQHNGYLHKMNPDGACTSRFDTEIDGQWFRCIECPDEDTFFGAAALNINGFPPPRRTDDIAFQLINRR